MAIVIKPGNGELSGGQSLSFVEAMATPGYFEPPVMARSEAGARIIAAIQLLETRISDYRRTLEHVAGSENIEARIAVNVKNEVRRHSPSLTAILGL